MMRQVCAFALVSIAACAGRHAAPASVSAPRRSVPPPDRIFGIVLRQPLNPRAVAGQRCFTARQFALEDGFYSIVTDDALLSVPHEHQDTAAVLAALDSFTVCRAHTRERNASVIITLLDSAVADALISWPDGNSPAYDSMLATLTRTYGEPFHSDYGVPFWSADSMDIFLTMRSSYDEGTTLTLSDARSCERYERMVHSHNSRDLRREPCWKEPQRLEPGEFFTEDPVALADSDLVLARVAYGADSAQVRRTLGAPDATDSLSWTYSSLRVWFKAGHVTVLAQTTPEHATARGLRVGDRVARAKPLYGTPCMRELWIYCRTLPTGPDGRGMMLEVKDHIITAIRVGTAFVLQ